MAANEAEIDELEAYVRETIGLSPQRWPGGWPNDIEAALIDAIFSIRAKYGCKEPGKETGVYGAVTRWLAYRGSHADDLSALTEIDEAVLRSVTNAGRASGRPKSETVIEAAQALVDAGVVHAADFGKRQVEAERAYLGVKGCGPVTWGYLRMLLGYDDVKPDTWVIRYVQDRVPGIHRPEDAKALVQGVAARLNVEEKQLDHAIWAYRRQVEKRGGTR